MSEWDQFDRASTADTKHTDPSWDEAEEWAANQAGVPVQALRIIRNSGEKSNSNQVSPAGAKGVYQFIPSTQQAFLKKYGVDAYSPSQRQQALAAAHHLKEGFERTGSWEKSFTGYNGGISGEKGTNPTAENAGYKNRTASAWDQFQRADDAPAPATAAPATAAPVPVVKALLDKAKQAQQSKQAYSADVLKMDRANEKPGVLERIGRPFADLGAGAAEGVGKILPYAEDIVRGRLGYKGDDYLSKPLGDFYARQKESTVKNETVADVGKVVPQAGAEILMGGKGVAPGVNLLKRGVANAAQGGATAYAMPPEEGETREGNAVRGAVGSVAGGEIGNALGKVANWVVRTPAAQSTLKAAKYLRKAAGGQDALEEGMAKVVPTESGLPITPASKMENEGVARAEQQSRGMDPQGWKGVDDATDKWAGNRTQEVSDYAAGVREAVGQQKKQSLVKVRMNDTTRGEIANGVEAMKKSRQFAQDKGAHAELDQILANYDKGGGIKYVGHLRQELEDFVQNSSKLTPEKKASYMKDFADYFDPKIPKGASDKAAATLADTASNEASSKAVVQADLDKSLALRDPAGVTSRNYGKASGQLAKAGWHLKYGNKVGAGLNVAKAVFSLRRNVPPRELQEALKSDEALTALIRRHDKVSSDEKVKQMVTALAGRAYGQGVAEEN